MQRAASIVTLGGLCVWSPAWLFVTLRYFHSSWIGPFWAYSIVFLPLVVGSALGTVARTRPERRTPIALFLASATVAFLAIGPVLRGGG
ncbi:MAG: hypothetical protein ABI332_13285 [Polyangiaceae bacterium]